MKAKPTVAPAVKGGFSDAVFYPIVLISLSGMSIFMAAYLTGTIPEGSSLYHFLDKSNLIFYLSSLAVFGGLFLLLRCLSGCFRGRGCRLIAPAPCSQRVGLSLCVILVIINMALLWHRRFISELTSPAGSGAARLLTHTLVSPAIATSAAIVMLALVIYLLISHRDCPGWAPYVFYLISLTAVFMNTLTVNIFADDLWHVNAYMEEIFNISNHAPYNNVTFSIYGHYGLLYYLPQKFFKLFVGSPVCIPVTIALFSAAAIAAAIYAVHHLLPKNWMKLLAALALVYQVTLEQTLHYFQVFPHRILFPCLFAAYMVKMWRQRSPLTFKWKAFGYGLGMLAVLWNTETGIFCLAGWSVYIFCEAMQSKAWYGRRLLPLGLFCAAGCVLSVLGAIAVVNLYNLACGGKLILQMFFFPLTESNYVDNILRLNLDIGNNAWLYVLSFLLLLLAVGLRHTLLFKKTQCWSGAPLCAGISAIGLLSFSYYANRAAYSNLEICYQLCIIGLALVINSGAESLERLNAPKNQWQWGKLAFRLVSVFVIACMALHSLFIPTSIKSHAEAEQYTTEQLNSLAAKCQDTFEPNTFGLGAGISFLYEACGWDNYGHYLDIADVDFVPTTRGAMVRDLLDQDSFIVGPHSDTTLGFVLSKDPSFQKVSEVTHGIWTFSCYSRLAHPDSDR